MSSAPGTTTSPGAPALAARGLAKRYGSVVALDGVDLEIAAGSIVGVAGPHGAGKSTLVHLLAGLAMPDSGTVEALGRPVRGRGGLDGRVGIGLVLEGAPAFDWMTGRETLAFAAALADVPRDEVATRVDAAFAHVGLAAVAEERVAGYGSETRRWLAIGQALAAGPDVLLLDAAPATFEPAGRRRLRALLRDLRGAMTVLLTTRHLADVEGLCDRLVLLGGGRVLADGPAGELIPRLAPAAWVIEADPGGPTLDGLAARLRQQPWVADAAVVGSALRVVAADEAGAARALLPAVAAAGLPITALRLERPPIEDVVAAFERAGGPAR